MEPFTAGLMSFEQALALLLEQVTPLQETLTLPLPAAVGRISATALSSPINVPPFDNSAMDGYALRMADLSPGTPLTIAGTALAGTPWQGAWPPGHCIRIMTGAALPEGCDAVVMQEQTQQQGDAISLTAAVQAGQNIRRAGEDIRAGQEVLAAGQRLGTTELPLLASLGIADVTVIRPLRVAILSTGDELQSPGQPLAPGQIYDTNRFAVQLMLNKLGCEVTDFGIIRDDPAALREALTAADQTADVVISSGGVSVGAADYTRQLLEELGEVAFWKLAIKPGKPFAFGRLPHSWFCGLPGNPVSAVLTFYQLVQPLLARLAGQQAAALPPRQRVRCSTALRKTPGRLDFQRGILSASADGTLQVASSGPQGSHVFSSYQHANCFIVLERERGNVAAGEWVDVERFNNLLES